MNPAKNIELKARLPNLSTARQIALRLATAKLGIEQQTDTYFHCPAGRMKLREIERMDSEGDSTLPPRRIAQLIWYERADQIDSKESIYQIVEIDDSARIQQLKAEMGIRGIVAKRREIFLYENVRIHLDDVEGLGTFIEFEAVLGDGVDAATGQTQVATLQKAFGISAEDLLPRSYSDMLLGEEHAAHSGRPAAGSER
jgi:adenylate cyclase, class 2